MCESNSIACFGFVRSLTVVIVAGLLGYEHSLVSQEDLSKINIAFFNMNGIISIALMFFVIADSLWV